VVIVSDKESKSKDLAFVGKIWPDAPLLKSVLVSLDPVSAPEIRVAVPLEVEGPVNTASDTDRPGKFRFGSDWEEVMSLYVSLIG